MLDLTGNDVPPEPFAPAAAPVHRRRKRVQHALVDPDKMVLASSCSTYKVTARVQKKNKEYGNDSNSDDEDRPLAPPQGVAHVTPQHTSFLCVNRIACRIPACSEDKGSNRVLYTHAHTTLVHAQTNRSHLHTLDTEASDEADDFESTP